MGRILILVHQRSIIKQSTERVVCISVVSAMCFGAQKLRCEVSAKPPTNYDRWPEQYGLFKKFVVFHLSS